MSKAAVNISLNKYEPSICLLHLEHSPFIGQVAEEWNQLRQT